MLSTKSRPPQPRAAAVDEAQSPAAVRRRRPQLTRLLGFVALMIVAGLLAVYAASQFTEQNRIVVATRDIAAGQTITAADLTEQTLGTVPPGVSMVPADEIPALVGKQALIDIARGSVLPATAIGDEPQPVAGRSLVGLRLEPGRTVPDIVAGDNVKLVVTPAPQTTQGASAAPDSEQVSYSGVVVSLIPALDGAASVLTVDVDAKKSTDIAVYAAQDRLAVVQESR